MLIVIVTFVGVLGLAFATTAMSISESNKARKSIDNVRARYLAEAGFERGMHYLDEVITLAGSATPLQGLQTTLPVGTTVEPFIGTGVMEGDSRVGAYTVSLTTLAQTANSMTIRIDSTGYIPDAPMNLADGQSLQSWNAASVTVRIQLEPSNVFNYAYFLNNWGWFYGSTIYANGNVRSNGQFDVAGYTPYVSGQPTYD